jgi:hypothetical protein
MPAIKFSDRFFKYENKKYFRANAHQIELCTFGEMKKPITGVNYLSPEGKIARRHLEKRPIKMTPSVEIDWSTVSEADLDAGAKLRFFDLGRDHSVSFDLNRARSAKLKLVSFYINEGPLKRCLNQDANAVRNAMADEGADARIVSEAWVAMAAELAEHFDVQFKNSNSVSAFGSELGITVSGGKRGDQTIKLDQGSIIAYRLHKVKKWSKDKHQIEDMEDDYYSFG